MNEVLGVLAFAILFAVFGALRSGSGGAGCSQCHGACTGVCEAGDGPPVDPQDAAARGGRV